MPLGLIVLTLAILFVAALMKATLGFGEGLIAMPLLTLILGIRTASPLMGLVGTGLAGLMLYACWRSVDLRSAWRLVAAAALGIPVGVWGLRALPAIWVAAGLGVTLILAGLYNLAQPALGALHGERWAYAFGFAGGILGAAYNTSGPPVVLYGTLRRWSPEKFRATLQGFFLPTGLLKIAGHGLGGLWTPQVLCLFALSVPVTVAALWLGGRLSRSIPAGSFDRVVYGALVVLGVTLIVQSL